MNSGFWKRAAAGACFGAAIGFIEFMFLPTGRAIVAGVAAGASFGAVIALLAPRLTSRTGQAMLALCAGLTGGATWWLVVDNTALWVSLAWGIVFGFAFIFGEGRGELQQRDRDLEDPSRDIR